MALHIPSPTVRNLAAERKAAVEKIVSSKVGRRLVLAGPGTGKTYSFAQALTENPHSNQVITFIRLLVKDMTPVLKDRSDVQTLHSYAIGVLHKIGAKGLSNNFRVYSHLPRLLEHEVALITGEWKSGAHFDQAMQTLALDEPTFAYLGVAAYYDAVSFVDVVYRLREQLLEKPDLTPTHELLVVDEIQDFTRLEVELIHQLGEASPVLAAGDDDQAIYSRRHASPELVRQMARTGRWEIFALPFCSRCTPVVVAAVHDILNAATENSLLRNRLSKPFECYMPDKEQDGKKYPKIKVAECSVDRPGAHMPARYVLDVVSKIPEEDIAESYNGFGYPTVLLIGPSNFTEPVVRALEQAGYSVSRREMAEPDIDILDGYLILRDEQYSRIGWRIVMECDPPARNDAILRQGVVQGAELRDLLDGEYVARHLATVTLLTSISNGDQLLAEERTAVEAATNHSFDELHSLLVPAPAAVPAVDKTKPSVLVTTYVGAKGLSGGHVFVVGMNEGFLPRGAQVTDEDVRLFLVALTRTRKECHLIRVRWYGKPHSGRKIPPQLKPSRLLTWIGKDRRAEVVVNAAYFAKGS
jgi:superfamily I DNA/RNA helicase